MIYKVEILGEEKQVSIDELIELCNDFTLEEFKTIYIEFPQAVRDQLRDYFKARMFGYLGM